MAKRSPQKRRGQRGSTMYSALAGLLVGLLVAAAVAFYVTKAPMPFVDRASRDASQKALPDPRTAPDPNSALYGRDGPAGTLPGAPTDTTINPPGQASTASNAGQPKGPVDDLGALIATLPKSSEPPPPAAARAQHETAAPSAATANSNASGTPGKTAGATPAAAAKTPPKAVASAAPTSSGTYYLQAGAFRGADDAESVKARILMLGLPAAIQRAEVNGMQINRVRVGPFARLDDMNRARSQMGENKIDSSVVRQ